MSKKTLYGTIAPIMEKSFLRTRTEKILYPIAIIFSSLVWLSVIFVILSPFILRTQTAQQLKEPCIFIEVNEYRFFTAEEAETFGYKDACLPREQIPDEVYTEVIGTLEKQAKSSSPAIVASGIVAYVLIFFAIIYASTALAMAFIRLNGVRLSPTQYSAFYKIYEQAANELGLKKIPHAYIIYAGGELNAFAVKVSRKKMIVFFAELIEALVEGEKWDELRAVAAHELTHVYLKHTHYWLLLSPFLYLPIFGSWLSRAREYSSDRGAIAVAKDQNAVTQALLKLITGKFVAREVNVEEYIAQPETERGIFVFLAKRISSHPPMPYRIKAVREWKTPEHEIN